MIWDKFELIFSQKRPRINDCAYPDLRKLWRCDAIFCPFPQKNWPVSRYRRILINSHSDFEGFENYRLDKDYGFTGNILKLIENENIKENILLLLDDYILLNNIEDSLISRYDADIKGSIACIRLIRYSDNQHGEAQGWKWPSCIAYDESYNYAYHELDYHSRIRRNANLRNVLPMLLSVVMWRIIRKVGVMRFNRYLPNRLVSCCWNYMNEDSRGWWSTGLPVSLQPTIWNIDFIKKHFQSYWSPWQQEVVGSRELMQRGTIGGFRCDYIFLTLQNDYWLYCNAVRDGKFSQNFST